MFYAAVGLLGAALLPHANGAVIQIATPGGFAGATLVENFEDGNPNSPGITFDNTAGIFQADLITGNVTPSGNLGVGETAASEPLRVAFSGNHYEIGAWFGNDDFGLSFLAILEIFDEGNNSLGSVTVAANRNDFADQFIGLRSDAPFRFAEFRFQRPQAENLLLYIDDLYLDPVDLVVPEPGSLGLAMAGLGAAIALRRHLHPTGRYSTPRQ